MGLELESIEATAKHRYIEVGRQFGSRDTLAQADKTLQALGQYGAVLAEFGFGAEDSARLGDARDALLAAGVTREGARAGGKTTSGAFLRAMRGAKAARARGRAVLQSVRGVLAVRADDAARAAVVELDALLARGVRSGSDPVALGEQLEGLEGALGKPLVAEAASTRGGVTTVAAIQKARVELRAAREARASGPGTPAETERLDLVDGIVVEEVRKARAAARAAATARGEEALAKAFALDRLYGSHGAGHAVGEAGTAGVAGAAGAEPAKSG